jgi:serine/threonine protein kinase
MAWFHSFWCCVSFSYIDKMINEPVQIGAGYTGKILYPCPKGPFEGHQFVMKIASNKGSLHSVKVANYIRSSKWLTHKNYLCLPETKVRDLSLDPIIDCEKGLGTFIGHAEKRWGDHYLVPVLSPKKEDIDNLLHLIEAIDTLHSIGITHNDIQKNNIMFVNQKPKLIDWETAALHRFPDDIFVNQVPLLCGRWFYCLFSGRLRHTQTQQIKFDWSRFSRVVDLTFPTLKEVSLLLKKGFSSNAAICLQNYLSVSNPLSQSQ